jgi:hypothetical protein
MSKTERGQNDPAEVSNPESDLIRLSKNNGSDLLAKFQVGLSLKSPFTLSDPEFHEIIEASAASYSEFAPADATERLLATLSVGLQNATMQSLANAANTGVSDVRNEEMRNAIRGAKAVAELLEALDRHRGRGKQSIAVGKVTVESGGQAIVGNVNTEASPSIQPEETEKLADDPLSQARGTRKGGSR